MPWEDVKDILRPNMDDIHMGVMKIDEDKCTKCELCMQNCPFQCWEQNDEGYPVLKENYACFSCYNCMIACPNDAISIIDSYHVDAGAFKTLPHPYPLKCLLNLKILRGIQQNGMKLRNWYLLDEV
ncbi:MAG: ATP-binding protein [Promethearchaeota archaeon]